MKEYRTTKEQCQKTIDQYGYVCDSCGRKIVPIETVDNSGDPTFWAGCFHKDNPSVDDWGTFTSGVPQEIFELAEKLTCQEGNYYSHTYKSEYKDTPEKRLYWFQTQTSGWCGLLRTINHLKINPPRKSKEEVLNDIYF